MSITGSDRSLLPELYVYQTINNAILGDSLLLDGNLCQPDGMMIEAIDLVDEQLVLNNRAEIYITGSPLSTDTALLIRGFTYAQSQGTYPWRGKALLVPGLQLRLLTDLGGWSVAITARVLPQQTWVL